MPKRAIARTLGVAESSVCYRLARAASGAVDGRSRQERLLRLGLLHAAELVGEYVAEAVRVPADVIPSP